MSLGCTKLPLTETVFRIHHDSPLASIFQEEKSAVASLWCSNGERDVIEVKTSDYASIKKMKKKLNSNSDFLSNHLSMRDNSLLILQRCRCYSDDAVAPVVARENCLLMPPIVFNEGWEHYKIVSMSTQADKRLFKDLSALGQLEILSRTPIVNTGIGGSMRISALSLFSQVD
jgi:predicted DNA binding protein